MGKLSLKDKVCIFIYWALLLMCCAAEQEYFPQSTNLTWAEARNHCQVCFKDLVTLTPENIQTIARNIASDCWVGLRKNLDDSTMSNSTNSSSSMPWSRWANGDPLTFQNWYPGWPVFKTPSPKRYCCSCPAPATATPMMAAPATPTMASVTDFTDFTTENVTSFTGFGDDTTELTPNSVTDAVTDGVTAGVTDGVTAGVTDGVTAGVTDGVTAGVTDGVTAGVTDGVTDQNWTNSTVATQTMTTPRLVEAECAQSSMLLPDVPETQENYIEDSCVVMLSFGAWVEKNCSELLSFVCYEDRFTGEVNVTNTNADSADLTWQPGPGNISHYRLEVNKNVTKKKTEKLSHHLVDLIPGTRYSVQVFPVKCERDLNPQGEVFYTTPGKVVNLTVTNVAVTSVRLSWKKPAGNLDFYLVKVQGGKEIKSVKEGAEVGGLIPGTLYKFTVLSGVEGNSTWSEESNITERTKPGKVSNLRVSDNTKNSLRLHWVPPKGGYTGFRVKAMSGNKVPFNKVVTQNEVTVTDLPMGSMINLSVTALTNGSLQSVSVTVVDFTAPGPISDLRLVSTHDSVTATWNLTTGDSSTFNIRLQLDGTEVDAKHNRTERTEHFDGLKTAANYTVVVFTFSGRLEGPPVAKSIFTKPSPPTNVHVTSSGKNQLTFEWTAPANIATVRFSVKINSSFWGQSWSETVDNKTSHTFTGLKSGTKYDFEVRTLAGELSSSAAVESEFTVAEKREIILSMLCSSAEPLLCDNQTTRRSVFQQLNTHFFGLLGENIYWELEKQEIQNN